jgi:5,10-methenyltetrahydrofolate synthetase
MADEDEPGEYASPPCFMHELDPAFRAPVPKPDPDVMRWRKAERERLIALRLALSAEQRATISGIIANTLDEVLGDAAGRIVSLYWPFRGEPDLRGWMESVCSRGGQCALPVVVEKNAPLVFREWKPGCKLERGIWNIPVPADGREMLPDFMVAPVVGFDGQCWRLGYGGGYYDRTLAAMGGKPQVIGVGYDCQKIATIHPQTHDIAMDAVLTELGVTRPRSVSG